MANTKKTQKDFFNDIVALAEANGRDDIVEFAKGRIEVLENKSKNKKPTKTQVENEALKEEIYAVLTNEGATVSEIISKSNAFTGMNTQKLTPQLTKLVNEGRAVKTMDKKRALFSLA